MSVQDKLINVAVRRILTSQWVDLTQVGVRSTGGVVYLNGRICRMTASHPEVSQTVLIEMDKSIRRIAGVRDVKYHYDNWERKLTGQWEPR